MMVRQSKIGSSLESKELVVFDILRDSKCTECGKELGKGDFLFMEGKHPVCLSCADFDHLIYLPISGSNPWRLRRGLAQGSGSAKWFAYYG